MKKKKTKPEKYTTEQIEGLLHTYLQKKDNLEPITAAGIARWCNEVLHMEPPLAYTDFTRKAEIKEKIQKYNERLLYAVTNPLSEEARIPTAATLIDIETVMSSVAVPGRIRSILQKANTDLEKLMEETRKLRRRLQEYQKTIDTMKLETESLLRNTDQMKVKIKDQRKELRKSSEEISRLKKIIEKQQEYIEEHVYEPISIKHFMEMGLEPDSSQASLPKGCDDLIVQDDDIGNIAEKFNEKEESVCVITSKTARLMDQLRNIGTAQ